MTDDTIKNVHSSKEFGKYRPYPIGIDGGDLVAPNEQWTKPESPERVLAGPILYTPLTTLNIAVDLGLDSIQGQQKPDDKPHEPAPDEEGGDDNGGITLVNEVATAPNEYHSRTRMDCTYQVVNRQVTIERQMLLASLQYSVTSVLIRNKAAMKARLERLLQSSFNLGLAAQMSVATGIPLVPEVGVGGKAGLSQQNSARLSAEFVSSIEADLILYMVHIYGNIWARKVVRVAEVWQWVGRDCPKLGVSGQGWENKYTLEGPWTPIPVDWTFVIPELKAPNIPAGGNNWARSQAKAPLHDKAKSLHDEMAAVPLPPFVPVPI
ncbi:MAG: hypothetical protein GY712_14955 [Oceanicoccus sp.]|uniref:hypothetical protein n=1 Tax=Oceanicoccus sp. TaxID=2691044 RepID=UPI002605731E|nr:hypothetical protein [Oceanicoccus sp.]MCP3909300.1 hypothetical protein [Oceanicoccus sp.]